ncbi:MAG: permease-like cell division protein FtsX [Candidatus Thiodiazotropha sp. (ex Lucinoma aequizonata)]|nr:permease-like cell division protein FtsX [Candidatus Thiodiazotropha sp. (ex Lucinoma aequizonata)]MCU7886922.1 permease-like cell division protein FtsX [Candidatus Thiodiazotropha sp. (ex Lucinoma aequizonata)]MCU7893656.1 permease-like cell division protein FtsX [Candidatus Thiodiazotropha sp. (ex Lucinoma aequizonata)]MCU7899375.1 permease-like cell division protein FtsX [Candidatus Thiodiazotropha sp. (ex Lucinoma aequizonata)]MCU7902141.1 permease-like cell division protein FtsX [Candid
MSLRKHLLNAPQIWLQRHAQVALASLRRLARNHLSSLMTCSVIGIALALPAGLHVMLGNLQSISGTWDSGASISLFLKQQIRDDQAASLAEKLRLHQRIEDVELITREKALAEFQALSGYADALEALDSNPLPALLIIQPKADFTTAETAQLLVRELKLLPEAEIVQLDLQWIRRLQAITVIAQRAVMVVAALLGIAVLLIIGNTIRLEIQNRRTEIEITKLIGATNAFIRRPFLYTGFWYGLFGGIIAWLLVAISITLLSGPITQLSILYQSAFDLSSLGISTVLALLLGSALLGLIGSWLAVGRHLSAIEPS